jgi:hypothetical protein
VLALEPFESPSASSVAGQCIARLQDGSAVSPLSARPTVLSDELRGIVDAGHTKDTAFVLRSDRTYIWLWARRIEKGIEPTDRLDEDGKRFRFPKCGPIPPPAAAGRRPNG